MVAKQRLDKNMALIKAKDLQMLSSDMSLCMDDPYKILNKSFWIRTVSTAGFHEKMLAHNKSIDTR